MSKTKIIVDGDLGRGLHAVKLFIAKYPEGRVGRGSSVAYEFLGRQMVHVYRTKAGTVVAWEQA